ncbi:hypothetical protein B0I37DRAFT_425232 [Chaetomium sp. MPI-CAGE-AT-0009]|nr:hypothetical protein B0I37DRAFT_425232 [Chaetomium sp. MPI-CAGE-AT-0009]
MATYIDGEVAEQQPAKAPRHEFYHRLRTHIEEHHRDKIFRDSAWMDGPPHLSLKNITEDMSIGNIESCCNKSAPIYILQDAEFSYECWTLLHALLHNYLYRTWFQPYRSNIDWGQFLAQPIAVHSIPEYLTAMSTRLAQTAHFAASLSRAICAHVETAQQKIGSHTHGTREGLMERSELRTLLQDIGSGAGDWEFIDNQRFLLLQPLFRAVAIVLRGSDYDVFIKDLSQFPVLLVLTGAEEGLSAPITFDRIADQVTEHHNQADDPVQSVATTLSAAVGFLMELEQRELAAFGPRPDPRIEPKSNRFFCDQTFSMLARWNGWGVGDIPDGPSSSWVDTDIYQEWTGPGKEAGEAAEQHWKNLYRRMVFTIARGEDPYYYWNGTGYMDGGWLRSKSKQADGRSQKSGSF